MANNVKVLIIDDELDFVETFRKILEARYYQVMTASNREQAQELMKFEPNMVVLGTLAPAGQAFAIHQWLKQQSRYKDLPLVVIDARDQDRALKGWRRFEGMQLSAREYVTKPVEFTTLLPRIESILEEVTRTIKILVVDDHTMVRNGICAVLALQKGIEVIGEAVDGQDALDKVTRLTPNIVLMDIVMPVMSGLEATKRIAREHPQTKVLILTQYDEEENMLVAKQAGAHGFIPKKAASSELVSGIKTISRGSYFPDSFAALSTN